MPVAEADGGAGHAQRGAVRQHLAALAGAHLRPKAGRKNDNTYYYNTYFKGEMMGTAVLAGADLARDRAARADVTVQRWQRR